MQQPCGRFVVGVYYCHCVKNDKGRNNKDNFYTTVASCDACEIWDIGNRRVPFNNSVDPPVKETGQTQHQAQMVLEQSGGDMTFMHHTFFHKSKQRITKMRYHSNRGGKGKTKRKVYGILLGRLLSHKDNKVRED